MSTSPKQQVSLIAFSTILAAFSLASIVNFTDPSGTSWLTFAFFFLSLFLVSLGAFTLIGLGLRQWMARARYVVNLGHAFRQAVLVSVLIVISFVLLSYNILYWWMELSLILFLITIEVFLNLRV